MARNGVSIFLQKPYLEILKGNKWRLTRSLIYHSAFLNRNIIVPSGQETDLASIPRFFHRVLPVVDDHRLAAIVHDFLYSHKGKIKNQIGGGYEVTREQADRIFLEAMRVSSVPYWKRNVMYLAVRAGGWTFWKD